jgi:cytochrome c peroxidase
MRPALARQLVAVAVVLLSAKATLGQAPAVLDFTPAEVQKILKHGPWPPPWRPDPSNRVSGEARAAVLGRSLFFEPRLSGNGEIACASCHRQGRGWSDARPRGVGVREGHRNTQSLFNVRYNRWLGWDGAGDSLWAQSLRPILDPAEMGGSATHTARLVREDAELARRSAEIFGDPAAKPDETVLVDVGKALAAFQETIVSGATPFDRFREALARADREAVAGYPLAAQRGLRLFIGKGSCSVCHAGPAFSNGEFHDIGIPYFIAPGRVDPGRYEGIAKLRASPFNLLGPHNDDTARATGWATRQVLQGQRNFGEFKVPGLRNVARTAPYMHNGSLATLGDVVRHYSEIDESRLHVHGERLLKPLQLADGEKADLIAFLESLSE